jgi:GTP-binding protein
MWISRPATNSGIDDARREAGLETSAGLDASAGVRGRAGNVMVVTDAEFVLSAAMASQLPPDAVQHMALVGRSNVGKSTLINALVRRKMARTSAKPGKTRLLNAYRVRLSDGSLFMLVDLPGYGYAGRAENDFDALGAGYFEARRARPEPTLALMAVDARHPGLAIDRVTRDWLDAAGVVTATVVTKLDKLKGAERVRHLREFATATEGPLVAVSAERGEGLDTLWTLIRKLLFPPS